MIVYRSNKLHRFRDKVSRLSQQNKTDVSEMIAEEFGANAAYVQGLLDRFKTNPELVDDSWRAYFSEMLGDGAADGAAAAVSQPSSNGAKAVVSETDGDAPVAPQQSRAAA